MITGALGIISSLQVTGAAVINGLLSANNGLIVARNITGSSVILSSTFSAANGACKIDANGKVRATSFMQTSTREAKETIEPYEDSSHLFLKVNPVTFTYTLDKDKERHYGFIAEELVSLYPALVSYDNDNPVAINYIELILILVYELQKQHQKIENVQSYNLELKALAARLARLEKTSSNSQVISWFSITRKHFLYFFKNNCFFYKKNSIFG